MKEQSYTSPITSNNRVMELDILRGFALLGILIANMPFFASPNVYLMMTGITWWSDTWNVLAENTIHFLASGKFFTMFSFLFGLGFVIFLQRAEEKTSHPQKLFMKRLLFLFIIGLIHAFGIWYGDILVIYALTGFLLLLFYKRSPKTLLVWAFMLIIIPASFLLLSAWGIHVSGDIIPPDTVSIALGQQMIDQSVAAYGGGSFIDILNHRIADYSFMFSSYLFMIPVILGMFLFGVYTAKTGRYKNIASQLPFFRRIWIWSLAIGLPFNILYVYSYMQQDETISAYDMLAYSGTIIGGAALCLFYMSSIVLLYQKAIGKRILSPLHAVGKLALSNYLLQSIVCTMIFYNYGLGLYGQVDPVIWFIIAGVLFALQVWLSNLWVKRFHFGPAEWIWRSLTYGRKQAFKIRNDSH